MHDTLANRSRVQYEEYTEEQRHQLHVQMTKWVAGEIEDLEVVNLRQVTALPPTHGVKSRRGGVG